MSVANQHAVRRNPAPSMHAATPAQRPAARASAPRTGFGLMDNDGEDSFKLNLSDVDIPRSHYQLDVEGFRPSVLSRLVGLFSR